ncbi:serine protein kinase [Aspergillus vadensis CBS 113365]|uniref:non-specific serine/threonine protein kinase n=1 Tax=Aspergillus vadensis (strain CBS 113365 / IMI 142717 / IBT 24658) TaxID=1448311 RepID=A0A319BN61_ASPVC|nr:serine protein kinase [Aspergillus vadensis CBS 113365]PYH73801.1 serine protein kinase [Aspergillus vadensis CBS 113365]
MRRFERIYDVVEPVEEYLIGKLAYGQYSTVWLARDQLKDSQQVVLKILKAEASQDNNRELSILLALSDSNIDHPGKKNVIELLDHFYHTGPNGTHMCLVLPMMISDGAAMTIIGSPREIGYIRAVSRHLSMGLDFLHQSGIVHCDLQPANILFSVAGGTDMEALLQPPEFNPVKWLEGVTVDDSAPEYLVPSQRRRGQLSDAHFSTLEVRIGDFGGAQYVQRCDEKPVTPLGLRAPELIRHTRDTSIDTSLDIWALGCLIFEIVTNEPLFPLDTFGITREEMDNDHCTHIEKRLGSNNQNVDFAKYLRERLPKNFGAENAESLASFLLLMLQIDPRERLSAKELLRTSFMLDRY